MLQGVGGVGHACRLCASNAHDEGSSPAPQPCTQYNNQKHAFARNNRHQPYLQYFQVKAQTEATQHLFEKFDDLFLKDQVWVACEIWEKRVRMIETTLFQESFLQRGLAEFTVPGNSVPDSVSVPIHYATIIGGEYLEVITNLDDKVIHHDLMVGNFLSLLLASSDCFPIVPSYRA